MSGVVGLILKALGTAAFIVALSEIAKKSTWLAAVLVALPLATMMTVAITAMQADNGVARANDFAWKTFLLVWPGLIFFVGLPVLQRFLGVPFWVAFGISAVVTLLATWGFTELLQHFGVNIKD